MYNSVVDLLGYVCFYSILYKIVIMLEQIKSAVAEKSEHDFR